MQAERWGEVAATLGEEVPVFLLGLVAIAALLLLVLFGGGGWRRRLETRARRTLERQRQRERGLGDEGRAAAPSDARAGLSAAFRRIRPWMQARDGLPIFVTGGVLLALAAWAALRGVGIAPWAAVLLALVLGVAAPLALRAHLRARWLRRFADEFPSAIDTMVRGLRAGLPLQECAELVAEEGGPEIATAFRLTLDDYEIGVPIEMSLERAAKRIQLDEVRFFAVVLALQTQTGGGLADMLETLSETLRKRRELADKVQIMSQEARSSAAIIGALPLLVGAILFMVSPEYVSILFTTTPGLVALTAAGLWMLLGVQIMRGMIRFDA